ncbi:manganese-dependent inorganic pyrophosphatase [Candidatus Gugararchaeum adminiculabundum]|nr:manganese-dependent inorganic pyrophosphatase [Candidatus Gugararchaeum adminiculabundum]
MGTPFLEAKKFLRDSRSRRILITFHSLGDADAVGAAFALKSVLPNSIILKQDHITREARNMIEHLGLKLDSILPAPRYDGIIVIDTASRTLLPAIGSQQISLVIDHHSKHLDAVKPKIKLIDDTASSSCEIVYELIKPVKKPEVAVCLLAGIIADSFFFRSANQRTFQAVSELLPVAEKAKLDYHGILSLIDLRPDFSQRIALLKAAQRVQFEKVGQYLIAFSSIGSNEAAAANSLVDLGADVAFVSCVGKDLRISGRMRQGMEHMLNLAEIMHQASRKFGGSGGGHPPAAGLTTNNVSKEKEALEFCVKSAMQKL